MSQYKEFIEKDFEAFLSDFKAMIEIPSVYTEDNTAAPFGQGIQDALEKMLSICKKLGFETYCDAEGYYGYADIGSGDEVIGVLGHLDVVPPGDLDKWATNPFEAVVKDGNLYGRGTQDDKGPTLAALYALKAVMDSGGELNKKIRFIFGTDEELLWRGIAKYAEKEAMPNYGFTPDANFPLIYAEKGLLQVDLVAQGTDGVTIVGGDAYNAVPSSITYDCKESDSTTQLLSYLKDKSYDYTVTDNQVTVIGKSVHAKDADMGINAIARLCLGLKDQGLSSKAIDFIVGEVAEDALATKIFGDCADEASGALKFNIGKIDVSNEKEVINIDIRIPVETTKEYVWSKLSEVSKAYGFELKENDYLKSIYTPLDAPLVKTLLEAYREVSGDMESQPVSSGGATYARAMDNCVAYGAAFPTSKETEHQPNEFINLEELKMAMDVYATAFSKLLKI